MVRVPNTISSQALGLAPEVDISPEPPLHTMSDREVGDFIRRCGAALRSHGSDFQAGHDKDSALTAFESTLILLLEVRGIYPARRADIDRILLANGHPAPDN